MFGWIAWNRHKKAKAEQEAAEKAAMENPPT
jgi:hypothetical protein